MVSIQTLKDLGEQMGLKGTKLRDFIKKQQDLDREERNRLREEQDKQREHDKIQQDKLDKFRLAQMEREKEKEQHEREEQDKPREHDKEQHEKDREFEMERMKFERDKMDFELQMKATGVKKASSVKNEDEEGEDNKEGSVTPGYTRQRIGAKGPKMPYFDEISDDMDSFLHRFEVYADSQRWSKGQWAVYLSALLKGKALEVYSRLPVKDAQDYEILRDALLKRFNLTEKGFKQKLKSARAEVGEAPTQFIARLENYFMRWIDLANVEKDFDGLRSLIVREQYLESCPVQLAIFLKERKPKDLSELASLAEQYLDAHASNKEWPRKPMFRGYLSPTSDRKFGSSGRTERIINPEVGRE